MTSSALQKRLKSEKAESRYLRMEIDMPYWPICNNPNHDSEFLRRSYRSRIGASPSFVVCGIHSKAPWMGLNPAKIVESLIPQ